MLRITLFNYLLSLAPPLLQLLLMVLMVPLLLLPLLLLLLQTRRLLPLPGRAWPPVCTAFRGRWAGGVP
jgi:hypothetical protein